MMTGQTVQEARSEKRAVANRNVLMNDLILSLRLPSKTLDLKTPDGKGYVHFGIPVKGGYINFHHFGDFVRRGNRIRVKATIMKKRMADGDEFLYVDLEPSENALTHELKIMQDADDIPEVILHRKIAQFDCLGGIKGSLVVCKPDN